MYYLHVDECKKESENHQVRVRYRTDSVLLVHRFNTEKINV